MSGVRIKIGGEFFREIREHSCYYADKTAFIEELLCGVATKVSCITRPRRFGKTLMMTMLHDFFDISQDSKAIFDGLAISKNKALCDKWMNQYPVLFFTLKTIEDTTFNAAVGQLVTLVRQIAVDFTYLLESDKVNMSDKRILQEFLDSKSALSELQNFIVTFCRALYAHWGRPAIVLIDEYDAPLAKAYKKGYYPEMVDFIRNSLEKGLKTNKFLQFAILTGGLRISKESLFSGLNNFTCYDISEFDFDDKFGFTSQEVDDLLAVAGCSSKKDDIQQWYDGYRFGNNKEMYCPWDILQYLSTLKKNPNAMPEAYWENSSGNDAIRILAGRTDFNAAEEIEKLLSGGYVASTIIKTITYDTLYASEDSLWTLLYQAGYLTKADPRKVKKADASPVSGKTPLVIPNKEIRLLFIQAIRQMTNDAIKAMDKKPFLDAFWNGDSQAFQDILSDILLKAIYYDKYYENFYRTILDRLIIEANYAPDTSKKSGRREDIIVTGPTSAHAAVIEVRYSRTSEAMLKDAEDALSRLRVKRYAENFEGPYKKIMLWGISFCNKSCVARAGEVLKATAVQ